MSEPSAIVVYTRLCILSCPIMHFTCDCRCACHYLTARTASICCFLRVPNHKCCTHAFIQFKLQLSFGTKVHGNETPVRQYPRTLHAKHRGFGILPDWQHKCVSIMATLIESNWSHWPRIRYFPSYHQHSASTTRHRLPRFILRFPP